MNEINYGTGVCVECGQAFKKINGIQRYCGRSCQRKAQYKQNLDWMRSYRAELRAEKAAMEAERKKAEANRKPQYASFKELADMNERARNAGMSYGKYVALLREGRVWLG